jgi:hypothetical protein
MNIVEALHNEEAKLRRQLTAVHDAIAALDGISKTAASPTHTSRAMVKERFLPRAERTLFGRRRRDGRRSGPRSQGELVSARFRLQNRNRFLHQAVTPAKQRSRFGRRDSDARPASPVR